MTEKDLQELMYLHKSIDDLRRQFLQNLDVVAARVEILLPEDSTPEQTFHKDIFKSWKNPDTRGSVCG